MNLEIKDSLQLLPGEWRWVSLNKQKNTLPLTKKTQKYSPKSKTPTSGLLRKHEMIMKRAVFTEVPGEYN